MFGILVYEIVSQREPHTDKDPRQALILIRWVCLFVSFSFDKLLILIFFIFEYRDKGLTPEIPSNCTQKLVELMQMCWKKQPQQRPVSSFFLFSVSSFHKHNTIIWFVSSLIEMLIGFWNNLFVFGERINRTQMIQLWN
jgi:hypothetical protein